MPASGGGLLASGGVVEASDDAAPQVRPAMQTSPLQQLVGSATQLSPELLQAPVVPASEPEDVPASIPGVVPESTVPVVSMPHTRPATQTSGLQHGTALEAQLAPVPMQVPPGPPGLSAPHPANKVKLSESIKTAL